MNLKPENIKRKNPISRNNMFFSKESYDFEVNLAREYMEMDMNQTLILFQVDLEKTKVNDVYKESDKGNIAFKTPVEITCIYEITDAESRSYDKTKSKSVYVKPGTLKFRVLEAELDELEVDIKRGDYIGVQIDETTMIYFVVNNDGKVNRFANSKTVYGFKPWYRECEANYVDETEFNG
jgi:activator of HSP90 ATPase